MKTNQTHPYSYHMDEAPPGPPPFTSSAAGFSSTVGVEAFVYDRGGRAGRSKLPALAGRRGGVSTDDNLGEGLGGSRRDPLLSNGPGRTGEAGDGLSGVMAAVLIFTLMRVVVVRWGNSLELLGTVESADGVGLVPVVDVWTRAAAAAAAPVRIKLPWLLLMLLLLLLLLRLLDGSLPAGLMLRGVNNGDERVSGNPKAAEVSPHKTG